MIVGLLGVELCKIGSSGAERDVCCDSTQDACDTIRTLAVRCTRIIALSGRYPRDGARSNTESSWTLCRSYIAEPNYRIVIGDVRAKNAHDLVRRSHA